MDYVGIDIASVYYRSRNHKETEIHYILHTDLNKNLGNAIEIPIPEKLKKGDTFSLSIFYNTN